MRKYRGRMRRLSGKRDEEVKMLLNPCIRWIENGKRFVIKIYLYIVT